MRSATVANAYDAMPPAPSASARASERTSPTRPMNLPAPRPPAIAPAPWNAPSTPRNAPRRWSPSCTTAKGMTSARPTPPAPNTTAGRMARNTGVVKKCRNPASELARAHAARASRGRCRARGRARALRRRSRTCLRRRSPRGRRPRARRGPRPRRALRCGCPSERSRARRWPVRSSSSGSIPATRPLRAAAPTCCEKP